MNQAPRCTIRDGRKRMAQRTTVWLVPVWLIPVSLTMVALVGVPASAHAQPSGVQRVERGDVHQRDLYAASDRVEIEGRLDGDLVAWARRLSVDGQVEGDLFAAGETVDIQGTVGDSTRVAASTVTVGGTIDGDLIALAAVVDMFDDARITGRLVVASGVLRLNGTVDGDVLARVGEVVIGGTVQGSANITTDRLELAPSARILGDLDYTARTPLSPEAIAQVAGTVRYNEPVEEEPEGITTWGVLIWIWFTSAALLAGILIVALFRRVVPSLVTAVEGQAVIGTLLGFAAFLVVPAGAVVAMVTLVGLPVGVVAVLLYVVALYLAKLPIAAWAGGRVLALAGRPNASPYVTMTVGILVLYTLFAIPYLGGLLWLVATWLGLGAMVLAGRQYLQTRAP